MAHSEFLATALEASRAATEVVQRYYQRNVAVRIKADKSPVTAADVEAEQAIRSIIAARYPTHGFYGEETGSTALDAEREYAALVSQPFSVNCARDITLPEIVDSSAPVQATMVMNCEEWRHPPRPARTGSR